MRNIAAHMGSVDAQILFIFLSSSANIYGPLTMFMSWVPYEKKLKQLSIRVGSHGSASFWLCVWTK